MSEITRWALLLQVGSTLSMVGLIWFVQIVHYPLFARVGRENFSQYERDHQRWTTWVVMPLMLTELLTAILLFWWRPVGIGDGPIWLGIVLVASIWLCTFIVQVPKHAALAVDYDAEVQRRLVLGNWYRTIAWTARGVLVLWIIDRIIP